MLQKQEPVSAGKLIALLLVVINVIALKQSLIAGSDWNYVLWVTVPMLVVCALIIQKPIKRHNVQKTTKRTKYDRLRR